MPDEVPEMPTPPGPAPAEALRPRPMQPTLKKTIPSGSQRPVKPVARETPAAAPISAQPTMPAPVVDYSRKPPARSTQPTVLFFQRTIIPPMLVIALGFIAFGIAYFTQSPDAALHRVSRNYAIGILAAGGISLACASGTMLSVRKQLKVKSA